MGAGLWKSMSAVHMPRTSPQPMCLSGMSHLKEFVFRLSTGLSKSYLKLLSFFLFSKKARRCGPFVYIGSFPSNFSNRPENTISSA